MTALTLGRETRVAHLPPALRLEYGETLTDAHVAFEEYGPADAPVVIVLGGISAGRHLTSRPDDPAPGWWPGQVGPGRALDTDRYRIVGIDYLGGAGSSFGAPEVRPRPRLPRLSPRDQAAAVVAVLDSLRVPRAHRVVGASYGGAVALALACDHPSRVEELALLCAAHRSHAMASALRSIQRRILRAVGDGPSREGVAIARELAMTTYRTAEEFEERFHGPPRWVGSEVQFPVEGYLRAHGERFSRRFDAESFLCLSESLDLAWIEPTSVSVPTRLWAVRTDSLVPLWLVRELAEGMPCPVSLTEVDSIYGHDAFLKEEAAVSDFLRASLSGARAGTDAPTVTTCGGAR